MNQKADQFPSPEKEVRSKYIENYTENAIGYSVHEDSNNGEKLLIPEENWIPEPAKQSQKSTSQKNTSQKNTSQKNTSQKNTSQKTSNQFYATNLSSMNNLEHFFNLEACKAAKAEDWSKAEGLWRSAADLNYPPAHFNLSVMLTSRKGENADGVEKHLRLAAGEKHPESCYNLAIFIRNRRHSNHITEEMHKLFTISENAGLVEAQGYLDSCRQ